jgi:hypothetical protein
MDISNRTFLEAIFTGALPGSHTIIAAFAGDPNTKDRELSRRNWCGWPWRPGERAPAWWGTRNAYFTVSTFEPCEEVDKATGEIRERHRRRKAQFLQMHAVMVDDIATKVPPARVRLPVSTLIETSPGNYQGCYLLADEPASRDRETCERLVSRMVAAGLAVDSKDPGMTGVTRYARLPVGVNAKAKYVRQLGHPFAVRLDTFEPMRRYHLAEIAAAYGLDITAPPAPTRAAVMLSPELVEKAGEDFAALLDVFREMEMYHSPAGHTGPWHDVTCPWVDEHTDGADTGAALAEPSEKNGWRGGFMCHHGSHCGEKDPSHPRGWRKAGTGKGIDDVLDWCAGLADELAQEAA